MAASASKVLSGKICVVTGASRGIGRGIALQLGEAGATVYITGRTLESKPGETTKGSLKSTAEEVEARGGRCIPVMVDHTNDKEVAELFDRVGREQDGQLDILVNNAYAAVMTISDLIGKPFWEQPPSQWDSINNVGLRNHFYCSVYAARLMVPRKQGLIVNISSTGGLSFFVTPAYGVGKEGCDRMAVDCAIELKKHNVAFVSLWPGPVLTEHTKDLLYNDDPKTREKEGYAKMRQFFDDGAESAEFSGKCIVKLASDPNIMQKSGRVLVTGQLGQEYGFKDTDGQSPASLYQVNYMLKIAGYRRLAAWIPNFVKIPRPIVWMASYRL